MKKPLRCWLTFHDWQMMVNDEGQRYKTCGAHAHEAVAKARLGAFSRARASREVVGATS
jgi:hypothetical protein